MIKIPRFMKEYANHVRKDPCVVAWYGKFTTEEKVNEVLGMFERGSVNESEAMLLLVEIHRKNCVW